MQVAGLKTLLSTVVRVALATLILGAGAAAAGAQSIVGTWGVGGTGTITFQPNGQWSWYTPSSISGSYCNGGAYIRSGTYLVSGSTISMTNTARTCFPGSDGSYGSGTYAISENGLEIHLTGSELGPIDFFFDGNGSTVPPETPLPEPQIDQNAYTITNGRIPAAAVQVSATGTFGNATVSVILDIVQALQTSASAGLELATGYNVYVLALVPGRVIGLEAPVWIVKAKAPGSWGLLQWPLAAFLENVAEGAADSRVLVEILTNLDISGLAGTEFYIGYGVSDLEMLTSGRYRGIFKAQ